MNIDTAYIAFIFIATIALVILAIDLGHWLGRAAHLRRKDEKESPVSAVAAAILGLLAFILAFTFGIVYQRFDSQKALVRDEANAIRTAYARAEFLAEPDRSESKRLLREYVDDRVAAVQSGDVERVKQLLPEMEKIQRRLWEMAVVNARKDLNSDIGALYVESINEVTGLHWLRVTMGMHARVPVEMWVVLAILVVLGMVGVGYQTAIAGSARKSWAKLILAASFSIVVVLIASLDRPGSVLIKVPQQPLVDLGNSLAADAQGR